MGIEILRMHTLNIDAARKHASDVGLSTPVPLTSGALTGGANTPYSLNTPDILNSLISITSNPFFEDSPTSDSPQTGTNGSLPNGGDDDRKVFATLEAASAGRNGSAAAPSLPSPESRTATVQSMRSQLIKDSLKLTIQSKRKNSGKCDLDLVVEQETSSKHRKREELTPEDEERRKRRRERNKVAATKCRNKKKEKTGLLVLESESLEGSNVSLKNEITKLELERRHLMEVLAAHEPVCNSNKQNNSIVNINVVPSPYNNTRDYNNRNGGGNIINTHPQHSHSHSHHHHPHNNNHYFVAGPTHQHPHHLQSTTQL